MISKRYLILGVLLFLFVAMPLFSNLNIVNDGSFVAPKNEIGEPMEEYILSAGENWLAGWRYRQKLNMYEGSGAGTDYPIKITVYYNTGSGPNQYVNCTNKCQTDFDDIRFTDDDGSTELGYYRESYTPSTSAVFWFKMNDDLDAVTGEVYVYYGNSGATYGGDGSDVFTFFDDFEDGTLDKWGTQTNVKIQTTYKNGNYGASHNVISSSTQLAVSGLGSDATSFIFDYYLGATNVLRGPIALVREADADHHGYERLGYESTTSKNYYYPVGGPYTAWPSSADNVVANTLYRLVETRTGTSWAQTRNGVSQGSLTVTQYTDVNLICVENQANYGFYLDDVILRKYVSDYPYTTTTNGEEESVYNNVAATCTNLDDTDNMYAEYKDYAFDIDINLQAGGTTAKWVYLSLEDNGHVVQYFEMLYTESTDVFSQTAGASYTDLISGTVDSKTGGLDLTVEIRILWACADLSNIAVILNHTDDWSRTDEDDYSTVYDIETRLNFTSTSFTDGSYNATRGDFNTTGGITASGNITYYGGTKFPLESEVWVGVNCTTGTLITNWEAVNYDETYGNFSVAVDSDDAVGLDDYYFKVTAEGAGGAAGTNLASTMPTYQYVADRALLVTITVPFDHVSVNTAVVVNFQLMYTYGAWEYIDDGTVTMEGIAATFNGANGWWHIHANESTVGKITYDTVVLGGDDVHGITKLDQNGQSLDVIWDRVNLTLSANYEWSIIGYNITLSATGINEYDSSIWNGTITWVDQYPSYETVQIHNFNASAITSITNTDYANVTVFRCATDGDIDIVFDDVVCTGTPTYYWVQYDENHVWLIWGTTTNWIFDYNNSAVPNGYVLQSQANGTNNAFASTYGGAIAGISIGTFDTTWYYANITIYAQFTAGQTYNFSVYSYLLEVDILHTIYIENFNLIPTDYYFWLVYQSNWNNATIMIWDDAVDAGTTAADSILNGTLGQEGMYQWAVSVVIGIHNVSILINGTATDLDEQNKNYVANNGWWWYNFTYVVVDILTIDNPVYTTNTEINFLSGYVSANCHYYIYENDTDIKDAALTAGSFSIFWNRNATPSLYVWGVKFNTTAGTTRWVNGSYYIETSVLIISNVVYSEDISEWGVSAYTNVDFNYTMYENNTLRGTLTLITAGSFYLHHLKNETVGLWRWAINCSDGTTSIWINGSYYNEPYDWAIVSPYTSTGEGITLEKFVLYVNGSRIYDRAWKFYNRTDYDYEICIQDYFGNELYNTTHTTWAESFDVLLPFYVLKIYSQIQEDPILFTLTLGGTSRSEYIGISEILRFYLAAGTYTYSFTQGGIDLTGTVVLSSASYYTIFDLDLWDIYRNEKGGGDDDRLETEIFLWVTCGLFAIIGSIWLADVSSTYELLPWHKTRKSKKKTEQPEHLKKYSYEEGENNQYDRRRRG